MDFIKIKISSELKNKSIRDLLLYFHLAKPKIYAYEMAKSFFLNEENVNQNTLVNEGDILKIALNENIDLNPVNDSLKVVYEDEEYLIVNKPRGILIHSDGVNNEPTLDNLVAFYYKEHHIHRFVRHVNRIDKETEGLVVYAKNPVALAYLDDLIAQRKTTKKYYALVYNKFSHHTGTIDLPIGKDRHEKNKMTVLSHGDKAVTDYEVLLNKPVSLVKVNIHTGRTHQIRVHMAYLNHPLLGDAIYGKEDNYPLMLQSYEIGFYSPFAGKNILVSIPLSKDLESVIYGK